ncbi:NADH-quinone oxidoreductase subunit J [Pleionea litopenaei]|uniref:NADH-quinone oxidoreductase subunit J n=1 Tax=Pleionea litopenaei TaxID=3070815 RepID=A0AA51RS01_9GAMM|nr:NADH-quinone oxidoreductase subunit J [Pleionea sp. HL-JVS1]WMS86520.1 NADH-quinone oxidoreductase subunit J [Pleionea sp. HL-JVS1]
MELTFQQILFYGFSALLICSSLMVILVKNSVKAVLFLILCFVSTSGIWMLLQAEFLAIALVLVYVGAVMVLFLFVVMMLDVNFSVARSGFTKVLPLALLVAIGFVVVLSQIANHSQFSIQPEVISDEQSVSNVRQLGRLLYTDYFYPFELAAVILLVAMIAAISLTFRGKRSRKSQNIDKQVKVTKAERLKIVKIDKPASHSEDSE